MKIATFNINGINGRLPALLNWLAREVSRYRLPAGAQGARRSLSPARDSQRGIRSHLARSALLERRRNPAEGRRARRDAQGPAKRPRRLAQPLYRSGHRRSHRRLPVPAERQSPARPEVRLQARLVRAVQRARRDTAEVAPAGDPGGRLQRRADRFRHLQPEVMAQGRATPARRPGPPISDSSTRAGPMRSAPGIPRSASIRSGITSGITGGAIRGCGSITCC